MVDVPGKRLKNSSRVRICADLHQKDLTGPNPRKTRSPRQLGHRLDPIPDGLMRNMPKHGDLYGTQTGEGHCFGTESSMANEMGGMFRSKNTQDKLNGIPSPETDVQITLSGLLRPCSGHAQALRRFGKCCAGLAQVLRRFLLRPEQALLRPEQACSGACSGLSMGFGK